MKAYVVMQGEYSDVHVVTVTLDKEKAEKLAKYHSSFENEAWVDDFEIDETPDSKLDNIIPVYYVIIQRDGSSTVKHYYSSTPVDPMYRITDDRNMIFSGHIMAKDAAHALKIARDQRAKMLAEALGL